ncbi:MFS transporter [Amaricoccus macauensis]|uniref:MFS transporter n=1 Tax=Amaricoccus macauensis TaxID=57001 RepID=UPI003C7BC28A
MSDMTAHKAHVATIDEVVTTVIMARVTDFFGFFVYAIASALVFPTVFFPMLSPTAGLMASFAVFSLAFLARPVSSLMARRLQYVIGRPAKVAAALMILGTATVAIGLLPSYERIGWLAPTLLIALRILQGIGLGGSWDGLTLQLQDAAPEGRKGAYAIIPQLGGPIGFAVASALFFVLTGFLTEEEFLQWGWRFAFFAAMALNVVSLFARIRLLSTDFGADQSRLQSAPLRPLIRDQWREILLSAFVPLASYALLHVVTVFPLGYVTLFGSEPISSILLTQMLGAGCAIVTVIISGSLADRYNRRTVMFISTLLIILLCLALPFLQDAPRIFILFGFVVLGLAYGQAGAIVPKRFREEYRYSGSALSTNLSWIIGAAFAPLVALTLAVNFGVTAVALYLLSGAAATLIALRLLNRREAR